MTDYTQAFFEKNSMFVPIVETSYYNWLKNKNYENFNVLETKRLYLSEIFGFEVGVDRISREATKTMRHIESYYYDFWVLKQFG